LAGRLAGACSHAVRKESPDGDFRIRHVTAHITARVPSAPMVQAAQQLVTGIPGPLPSARVDAIERDGPLVVMESELIEPYVCLAYAADAPVRLAAQLCALVESTGAHAG
jgi:hypothetical protein